jgi:outer membrane lipoprotein-sorting protein
VIALLATLAWADEAAQDAFAAAIDQMAATAAATRDATYRLHQTERVGGKVVSAVIDVKIRPPDVFLSFPERSTRVLYRGPGWNDGKLMADPGPLIPTLSLDIDGTLAMRGQRHSIRLVGFRPVVQLLVTDADRLRTRDQWTGFSVRDEGTLTERGEAARCFHTTLPRAEDPAFYADEVRVCVSARTGLPARIQAWERIDGALVLVEDYAYTDVRTNVGLADADFDPEALGM